jgi:hypothetical protein
MRSITGECKGASDCDLATFLEQDYQHDKDSMVWKWFLCLSQGRAAQEYQATQHSMEGGGDFLR